MSRPDSLRNKNASTTTNAGAAAIPFGHIELPRVSITSYGVKLRLPVLDAGNITIAVLLCKIVQGHVGLFI